MAHATDISTIVEMATGKGRKDLKIKTHTFFGVMVFIIFIP